MNKKNIKSAIKKISYLIDEMDKGIYMDNLMDDSGECGHSIFMSHYNWFNLKLNQTLDEYKITIDELLICTDDWAKKELSMRPKKEVFIKAFTRRAGFYKQIDYFDTKYGQLNFFLQQLN